MFKYFSSIKSHKFWRNSFSRKFQKSKVLGEIQSYKAASESFSVSFIVSDFQAKTQI